MELSSYIIKKFLNFLKRKLLFISGRGNPRKIIYISGNKTFIWGSNFLSSENQKTQKMSYILGNETF